MKGEIKDRHDKLIHFKDRHNNLIHSKSDLSKMLI